MFGLPVNEMCCFLLLNVTVLRASTVRVRLVHGAPSEIVSCTRRFVKRSVVFDCTGKGLGKEETGISQPIKVCMKRGTAGVRRIFRT